MRGHEVEVGTTRCSKNGYWYKKTEDGWRLLHHIIMEETLGRSLHSEERVYFCDGNRGNLDPSNIVVRKLHMYSVTRRRARIQAAIEELQAQLVELDEEERSQNQLN